MDKVFALIGYVGTPASSATQPIATEAGVPFIGPSTGAEFLRTPFKPNVVNVRASYFQETEEVVERLTNGGFKKIAILYEDEGFGRAGLAGVKKAMDKHGIKLLAEGTYTRNTVAMKDALVNIRNGDPEAVIMIGTYKRSAEFIRLSRKSNFHPLFFNISFVGADALAEELGAEGNGVVITRVVPSPNDRSIPLVARYQEALKEAIPEAEPGFASLEGYMVGRVAIEALRKVSGEPTRKALLDAVFSNSFDLGGVTLNYGRDDNQGMDHIFLNVIDGNGILNQASDECPKKNSATTKKKCCPKSGMCP